MYGLDKENTVENALTTAKKTGNLRLSKRTLKTFPLISARFNLVDLLSFDLSFNKLTEFPKQLCNCPFLLAARLTHNLFKSLPDEFSQLHNLQILDLSYNCLVKFPTILCQLDLLQTLLINNNKLTNIPAECGLLTSLVVLDASSNDISSACSELAGLSQLRVLKLRNNALESVPREWGQLGLQCLDLADNQLTELPSEYWQMQASLTELHLEINPLVSPPSHVCARGLRHALKFLSVRWRQTASSTSGPAPEMPAHYNKGHTAGSTMASGFRVGLNQAAFTKNGAIGRDRQLRGIAASTVDGVDGVETPDSETMEQLNNFRMSLALSASQSSLTGSTGGQGVKFSSSSSVLQRLEQQSSRLGGSNWTLPRRYSPVGEAAPSGLSGSELDEAAAVGAANPSVLDIAPSSQLTLQHVGLDPPTTLPTGPPIASISEGEDEIVSCAAAAAAAAAVKLDEFCAAQSVSDPGASAGDASALAAMRGVFERRLGVRLPDRVDRLAERLADGQLLARLAELAGPLTPTSPGGRGGGGGGGFSELCRRLGVSEMPPAQSTDPVVRHLIRTAQAAIALESRMPRLQAAASSTWANRL